jgi:hypothetical protein
MQVIVFNSRVALRPTLRVNIATWLIAVYGTAVEESHGTIPGVVSRPEDIHAEKWIVLGASWMGSFTGRMLCHVITQQTGDTSPFP